MALLLLMGFAWPPAHAQEEPEYSAVAQFSLFPFLGTNGVYAHRYSNNLSFNATVGVSRSEVGFGISGLVNAAKRAIGGFHVSGLANIGGERVEGFQLAGVANGAGRRVKGIQLAGLANAAGEQMRGMQWAGLANVAVQDMEGCQVAGLVNAGLSWMSGCQLAGVANVSRWMTGIQVAGLVNVGSDRMEGFQLAGLANVTGGDMLGMQCAGVFNVSRGHQAEAQIAGLFNVARVVGDFQFALLLNVAAASEYPIGILNLIRDGQYGVAVQCDDWGTAQAVLRSGGVHTYGVLGMGYNPAAGSLGGAMVAGWGYRAQIASWLRLAHELTGQNVGWGERFAFRAGYSLLPFIRISGHWEAFAAVGLHYAQAHGMLHRVLRPQQALWRQLEAAVARQLQVGFQVGMQYTI